MQKRTITISGLPSTCTEDQIKLLLRMFALERVFINSEKALAYVEFKDSNDIEAMASKYEDCKMKELGGAEINLVDRNFIWENDVLGVNSQPAENQVDVDIQNLISIKNCDNLENRSNESIKKIFQKFSVKKLIKVQDKRQVILEFGQHGELELLDMQFQDYKVPQLGINAHIDPDHPIDLNQFIYQYQRENQTHFIHSPKKISQNDKGSSTIKSQDALQNQLGRILSQRKQHLSKQETSESQSKISKSVVQIQNKEVHLEKKMSQQNFKQQQKGPIIKIEQKGPIIKIEQKIEEKKKIISNQEEILFKKQNQIKLQKQKQERQIKEIQRIKQEMKVKQLERQKIEEEEKQLQLLKDEKKKSEATLEREKSQNQIKKEINLSLIHSSSQQIYPSLINLPKVEEFSIKPKKTEHQRKVQLLEFEREIDERKITLEKKIQQLNFKGEPSQKPSNPILSQLLIIMLISWVYLLVTR